MIKYEDLKKSFPVIGLTFLSVAGILGIFLAASRHTGVPFSHLTRDPSSIVGFPVYIGCLSHLGILLWCATAAICFFSYFYSRKSANKKDHSRFLLASGLLSGGLMMDDLFLFHEYFFPTFFHITEEVIYGIYGITAILYLVGFRKTILRSEYVILLFSLFFLAASIGVDVVAAITSLSEGDFLEHLLEDGFKLMGITFWFVYFFRYCLKFHISSSPASNSSHFR